MFFKKNNQPTKQVNPYDAMYREKRARVESADLRKSVIRALNAQHALSVYSDGPEKEEALSRLERAKKRMTSDHKAYTKSRDDVIEFFDNYRHEMDECFDANPSSILTAYYIVEFECQRYYK